MTPGFSTWNSSLNLNKFDFLHTYMRAHLCWKKDLELDFWIALAECMFYYRITTPNLSLIYTCFTPEEHHWFPWILLLIYTGVSVRRMKPVIFGDGKDLYVHSFHLSARIGYIPPIRDSTMSDSKLIAHVKVQLANAERNCVSWFIG